MTRRDFRIVPRFPRTTDEAFRTPAYGAAVEIHTRPPLWRRIVRAVLRWL
jgi:hypothetical protein